ncbi:hypothetical protein J8631_26895 [Serratia fonticola]|uniref:hypothetical protein n=1 Tax=Serratia fonticola TaxID=47917 RepID=UPI001AE0F811|nr:hypothetical protein [Serratia fonticola]MBP1039185.1 hypothetical protein [Serratia fonticola]
MSTILEVVWFSFESEVVMWGYVRQKVANHPKVKALSQAERKRIGGRFFLYGTLLLAIPMIGMLLSYNGLWMHVIFQTVWAVSMIVGGLIAFESEPEARSGQK